MLGYRMALQFVVYECDAATYSVKKQLTVQTSASIQWINVSLFCKCHCCSESLNMAHTTTPLGFCHRLHSFGFPTAQPVLLNRMFVLWYFLLVILLWLFALSLSLFWGTGFHISQIGPISYKSLSCWHLYVLSVVSVRTCAFKLNIVYPVPLHFLCHAIVKGL